MSSSINVLLLGSGGREHALAWKLAQSPLIKQLYIAPGNAGTALHGTNVPLSETDFKGIRDFTLSHEVNMMVVGPEVPLVMGIHDFFLQDDELAHIPVIGPVKAAAMLEGSKDFSKDFMTRHGIPTAAYRTFRTGEVTDACAFLETLQPPYVLKADGLAAGKGVVISPSLSEAKLKVNEILLQSCFGEAGNKLVIEEFLSGIELSAFVLTDGIHYVKLPEAKDYKRIGEGDTGPNTGGMGSVSPVPFAGESFLKKVEDRIIKPTLDGLKNDGITYQGFIFFGIMNVDDDPYVIEYNCRLGDPETESILPRIENDMVELFLATANQELHQVKIRIKKETATCVMLVSGGYPGPYPKDKLITGLDKTSDALILHAGTRLHPDGTVKTNGGRVIGVTTLGNSIPEALQKAYRNAEMINFDGKYFRRDIGQDLLI